MLLLMSFTISSRDLELSWPLFCTSESTFMEPELRLNSSSSMSTAWFLNLLCYCFCTLDAPAKNLLERMLLLLDSGKLNSELSPENSLGVKDWLVSRKSN